MVTKELLAKIFPNTSRTKLSRFVSPFNTILPKYGITTKKRFAAFIANVGIESDRLKTLKEYGGTNYFKRYNDREDLGNVREGDGVLYPGRSVLQTTGRYNYWRVVIAYLRVLTGKDWDSPLAHSNFSEYLRTPEYDKLLKEADKHNVNFLAHPEMLETFPHAVEAAGIFVKDNNLNKYADEGKFSAYAGVLNRGDARKKALHYTDRLKLYKLALDVIPDDFNLENTGEFTEDKPQRAVEVEVIKESTGDTAITENVINEQDVTTTAQVEAHRTYNQVGFIQTVKNDLKAVGVGNVGFQGTSELVQNLTGIPEWIIPIVIKIATIVLILSGIWMLYRLIHYLAFLWKERNRINNEVNNGTDVKRKDIEWV